MTAVPSPLPPGCFCRSAEGAKTAPVTVPVEAARIRAFCAAIGETAPVHTDEAAARAAGHPGLLAPPTFAQTLQNLAETALAAQGSPGLLALLKADFARILHGQESYSLHAPIHAGDAITVQHEITGFRYTPRARIDTAHSVTRFTSHRGLCTKVTRTLIHRLPA